MESFISRLDVVEYSSKAAEHYGNIHAVLEKQGQAISVNDLHIAGHARSEGLILVANNLKEFSESRRCVWIAGYKSKKRITMSDQKPVCHLLGLSGGKDSAALAIYLRDKVPEMEYFFADTGAQLTETLEFVDLIEGYLEKNHTYLNSNFGI